MLGLPKTTPTAAIMFATGALYASIRAQIKQLIYLHRVLLKGEQHWTYTTLHALQRHNRGWAKQIEANLAEWHLETSWEAIARKSPNEWKRQVYMAAEKRNKERVIEECYKKERGVPVVKSKTRRLLPILQEADFVRKPQPFITNNNKLIARAYIMGRFGMLQCATNFSNGYGGKDCARCRVEDNEMHRINECPLWIDINLINSGTSIDFDLIHSDNVGESMKVIEQIITMWDLGNNCNSMRCTAKD